MFRGNRQKQANIDTFYSEDQVRRSLLAAGITIAYEVESDFIIFCPYHNNSRSPAAEISKESGLFYCFGCQETHTLIEVIMHYTRKTYFESARLIDSNKDNQNFIDVLAAKLEKKEEFQEFDKELIYKLNANALTIDRAVEYYKGRGITKDSVVKYQLGYSDTKDMVTIPVHSPDGICIGFVGRSVEGKAFKNSQGLKRSNTMFNLFRAKRFDKVFVVESSFDAIRLEQVGAHAVATLGASVSKNQRELLKRYFNNVIILGDNDEAGREMSHKLVNTLGDISVRAELPGHVKDVSDLSDIELKHFVSKFDDLILTMLQ